MLGPARFVFLKLLCIEDLDNRVFLFVLDKLTTSDTGPISDLSAGF
jgi:hypothetical protein